MSYIRYETSQFWKWSYIFIFLLQLIFPDPGVLKEHIGEVHSDLL